MILLDTNVVSAIMRLPHEPRVLQWLDAEDSARFFICTPVIFELKHGIERLAGGRRRLELEQAFADVIFGDFGGRILDFDRAAAIEAGRVRAHHLARGLNVDVTDHQIAGIAAARGAAIATRNVSDFAGLEIKIVNPWQ